ncbi:MAG TPA: response regulator [Thermoanaerobaculia bacterium]|nr:response regulator [Thermoanaerobaculia bacterium]
MGALKTILIVDDDAALRETLAANVELAGYDVLEAVDGAEALRVLREHSDVSLVVSDIRMPGLNGVELLKGVRQIRPLLPVILTTGYSAADLMHDAMLNGVFTIVHKPFDMERLLTTIERAARHPAVLILDDAESELETLSAALEICGHKVKAVKSADRAIEAIENREADIVLADIVMPITGGLATLEKIRKAAPSVSVIMITGTDLPELINATVELGAFACMQKPLDVRAVCGALSAVRWMGSTQ